MPNRAPAPLRESGAHHLDETERTLRAQRYLGSAEIVTTRYNEDSTVDVLVQVPDVWTLVPNFSFSRKGAPTART
jgi:hypothetical protein